MYNPIDQSKVLEDIENEKKKNKDNIREFRKLKEEIFDKISTLNRDIN